MKGVLVAAPLRVEAVLIASGARGALVRKTGMGPDRAKAAAGELIGRLTGNGMKVRSGNVVCVSRLALGERRAELHAGGAIAVDMESVWLAAGAGGRPFGVVRVVLDSPAHELMRPQAAGGALRAAWSLRRVAAALADLAPGV